MGNDSETEPGAAPANMLSEPATFAWQIVDWTPEDPFSGRLVFTDDSGPILLVDLNPLLVRDLSQALNTVRDAQRHALLGTSEADTPQRRPAGPDGTKIGAADASLDDDLLGDDLDEFGDLDEYADEDDFAEDGLDEPKRRRTKADRQARRRRIGQRIIFTLISLAILETLLTAALRVR